MKFKQLLLLFSTIAILGCADAKVEENKIDTDNDANVENISAKTKAPDFILKDVKGKDVKLSDYKGKIVIIDFWATWCGPCRMGIPDLVELQNEYKNKLVVLGVSLDKFSGTDGDIAAFMKEFKINYPIVFGDDEAVQNYGKFLNGGLQSIPTTFIIDQNGNVIEKYIGLVKKSAYVSQIKSLLGKS